MDVVPGMEIGKEVPVLEIIQGAYCNKSQRNKKDPHISPLEFFFMSVFLKEHQPVGCKKEDPRGFHHYG